MAHMQIRPPHACPCTHVRHPLRVHCTNTQAGLAVYTLPDGYSVVANCTPSTTPPLLRIQSSSVGGIAALPPAAAAVEATAGRRRRPAAGERQADPAPPPLQRLRAGGGSCASRQAAGTCTRRRSCAQCCASLPTEPVTCSAKCRIAGRTQLRWPRRDPQRVAATPAPGQHNVAPYWATCVQRQELPAGDGRRCVGCRRDEHRLSCHEGGAACRRSVRTHPFSASPWDHHLCSVQRHHDNASRC